MLPNSKKAFTLAEVLITLSILGVVAYDSANSPKYGVAMRADEGAANKSDTKSEEISNVTLDDTDGVKVFTVKTLLGLSKPSDATTTNADIE